MTNEMIEKYDAATSEYLDRLTWNGVAPTTKENYAGTLRLFGDFLRATDADDLYEAVEAWKESMLRSGNAGGTVNVRLTELSIFFSKASKRSFPKSVRYSDNPVEEVELVKVAKHPYPDRLTPEQIMKLYENNPYPGARLWARTYAIIQLLLSEKLRNSELTSLRLSDLDMRYHELTVRHGKGDKSRTIDLCELSESAIVAYLESGLRPANLSDDDYLFGSIVGGKWSKMSRQGLSKLVEHHIAQVTGQNGLRSHSLRHTGSRICLNAGMSIEELQGNLGHADIKTSQIYAGRVLPAKRHRDEYKAVLSARDAAAQKLQAQLDQLDMFTQNEKRLAV